MKTGSLLLIDEISLANDSVLERLNSVFEHGRTLTVSEKDGSSLKATQGFNVVATMNPSGDFGKKELSPALRNRMTEIWVESYFSGLESSNIVGSDLHMVAKELVCSNLGHDEESTQKVTMVLLTVILDAVPADQRANFSIRDIVTMVEFLKMQKGNDLLESVVHACEMVMLDAIKINSLEPSREGNIEHFWMKLSTAI